MRIVEIIEGMTDNSGKQITFVDWEAFSFDKGNLHKNEKSNKIKGNVSQQENIL